ncbi:hypothetical protein P7C70_g9392, partial [Phenoliferia sp. Uapishka_3]
MSTYVREATPSDYDERSVEDKLAFTKKRAADDQLEQDAEKRRWITAQHRMEDEHVIRLASAVSSPAKASGAPKAAELLGSLSDDEEDEVLTIHAFPQAVHAISPDIVAAARYTNPMPFIPISACGQLASAMLKNGERQRITLTPGKGAGAQHSEVGVAAQKLLDGFAERDYCLDPVMFWECFRAWAQLMAHTRLKPEARDSLLFKMNTLQQLVSGVCLDRHWCFWRDYALSLLNGYSDNRLSKTGGRHWNMLNFEEDLLRDVEAKYNYEINEAFRFAEDTHAPMLVQARLPIDDIKKLRKALATKATRVSRYIDVPAPSPSSYSAPPAPQQRQQAPPQHRQQPQQQQQQQHFAPQFQQFSPQQFNQQHHFQHPPPQHSFQQPPQHNAFSNAMKRSDSAPPAQGQNFRNAEQRAPPTAQHHLQGWCPGCCKHSTDPTHFWKVCRDFNAAKVYKYGAFFHRSLDRLRICMQWNLGICNSVGPCSNFHGCAWCGEEGHISFDCPTGGGPTRV